MSGISVLKDGNSLFEYYGTDLDKLNVGDRIGVMRTAQDELIFYINGESQGVAATNIPKTVYALVNLYGKCVQVSIYPAVSINYPTADEITTVATVATDICQDLNIPISVDLSVSHVSGIPSAGQYTSLSQSGDITYDMNDRLRFHNRCGSLVKLSVNCRTAERRRPLDEVRILSFLSIFYNIFNYITTVT